MWNSAVVAQVPFHGETSDGVRKCQLFSHARSHTIWIFKTYQCKAWHVENRPLLNPQEEQKNFALLLAFCPDWKKKAQYSNTQPKLMKEDKRGQLQANFHCYSLKIFICFWLAQILRQNLFKTNKYYASSYGVPSVMFKKVITISILRPKTALFSSTSTCQTVPAYIGRAMSWCYFWWQTVQSVPLVLQLVHLTNLKPLSWSPCQEAQTGLGGSGMPDNKKEKEMCTTGKN